MSKLSLNDIDKILASSRDLLEQVPTEQNNWDLGILVHGPSEGHMYLLFYLRSRMDPTLLLYVNDLVKTHEGVAFKDLKEQAIETERVVLLRPIKTVLDKLNLLQQEYPPVERILNPSLVTDLAALQIDYDEFNALREISDDLSDLGFEIKLEKSIRKIIPEKNTVSISLAPIETKSQLSVFDYDLLAMIDDEPYTLEDLEEFSKSLEPIIQLTTGYIEIQSIKNLKQIIEKISDELNKLDMHQKLSLAQGNQLILKKSLRDLLVRSEISVLPAQDFDHLVPIPSKTIQSALPKVKLFPYQIEGVKWLVSIALRKLGGVLADDMGMGKTIQTIAMIAFLFKHKHISDPVLIITPQHQSLLQWQDEIETRSSLRVEISYGTSASGRKTLLREMKNRTDLPHVVITTIKTLKKDVTELRNLSWSGIILDEAQIIKSPDSSASTKMRMLAKKLHEQSPLFRLALTGTPIENTLIDLWTIFDFTMPKYLPRITDFRSQFGLRYKDLVQQPNRFINLERLIFPFLLRRNKDDYLDLPDKNEVKVRCSLSKTQIGMYTATVNSLQSSLYEYKQHHDPKAIIGRSSHIFSTIIKLKQICDHPFSLKELYNPKSVKPQESHKITFMLEILKKIREKGEKVLIYTQYINVGKIIQKAIVDAFNIIPPFYSGQMSSAKREKVRKEFTDDPDKWILILSLKSGGVGLNLQAASNVIHFDRWYNPAIENQATDRAYRYGQDKEVTVYKLIAKGTIEERIDEILEDKMQLSGILNSRFREGQISQLEDKDLLKLLLYKDEK
ncbi:MAG: DEAD/DEAH box helicase [Candidatus Heimdallarchaeota archaeon]|nr:DEAD/DEAH box helicase [Candidatus Heimdallarchaeota archaeon]